MEQAATQKHGFELVRRLASGGMGEVFIAKKTGAANFEKHVALKLLLPHLTALPESVRRFHAEARLAARMHHPNIVEIFDVGEAEGRPFIAMQLVEGVSLSQYLRYAAEQRLTTPLPIVRAITLSVCEALAYAHELKDAKGQPLKLVHRDVTPSNVLLSYTGGVQLTDFGIARVGETATRAGVLQGKAAYVAPEQLTHEAPVDARADLYSAAVTLYELLTGTNPFRRATQEQTFEAVLEGTPPPIRTVRPDVSPQMEAALRRAMARRPGERFADATSFRKAFVDGPVASAPDLAEHLALVTAPFRAKWSMDDGDEGPGTMSQVLLVTHSVSADLTPVVVAPSPRWPLAVGMVLGLVLFVGVGAGLRRETLAQEPRVQGVVTFEEAGPTADGGRALAVEPLVTVEKAVVEPGPEPRRPVSPPPRTRVNRPAPPPPAPPAAALRIGYLAADAVPWADVLINGARVDRTPFSKYPLPVGKHQVTFRAPDGRTQRKSIAITEGATTSLRVEFSASR
ncbi:MAG: serine/threonine-protein kinase [Myxococcales bacterium]|nr:serine/threonine-protein kinase [Myxococcales bacterium]MDP3505935.1 serine/threonine-protein kinase [Myxococcales bacterium]